MDANNTHKYSKKTLAKREAQSLGLDTAEAPLHYYRAETGDGMKWGWCALEDWEIYAAADEAGEPTVADEYQSVEAIMARNAARNAGLDIDATATEVPDAASVAGELATAPESEPEVTLHVSPEIAEAFGMGSLVEAGLVVVEQDRPIAGPVGVDSEIARFRVVDYPVARLPVVAPYVAPVAAVPEPEFPTEGDTYLRLGPFTPYEGKSELLNLAKRMGIDGELLDSDGRVIFRTTPKVKVTKLAGPRRIAMGASVGDDGKPVRPTINSVAHKSSEKLLDRIEQCEGDLGSLLALVGTPGFNGGFTYGNIVVRYLNQWISYARQHPANDEPPGVEVFAEAAD